MEHLITTITAFIFVVLVISWFAERWRMSAPVLLLIVGVAASYLPFVHMPALEPEFVLVGLLPPLLYSAAVNTPLADFRHNIRSIGWLSIGLVLFTAAGVGLVAWAILGIPLAAAFALGAIVAPPDAVAATAVARRVGLPRRVVTVLEGESLVNDATALVSLRSALLALSAAVTALGVLGDFVWAVVVGIAVGVAVSQVAALAFRRMRLASMTTALSFLVPFAAYVPAETLHGSGVLAVVVAGLLVGHRAQRDQSAFARLAGRINWSTISFVLENAVFLLIGVQARTIFTASEAMDVGTGRTLLACLAVLVTVMVLRLIGVLVTFGLFGRRHGNSLSGALVIGWAGMRGVVTLAAALSLPETVPHRAVLIMIALVVTLGTLGIQSTTLGWVARRLGVRGPDPREDAVEEAMILQRASAAGVRAAEEAAEPGDEVIMDDLRSGYERRVNGVWERLGRPNADLEPPVVASKRLRRVALAAQRDEVLKIRDEGQADQSVIADVLASLDLEESMLAFITSKAERIDGAEPFRVRGTEACAHLREAPACATPDAGECTDCVREHTQPVHLRLCLDCGHVACCDSSTARHATRHYEETGHPVMRSFEPGESWRWCYLDSAISE